MYTFIGGAIVLVLLIVFLFRNQVFCDNRLGMDFERDDMRVFIALYMIIMAVMVSIPIVKVVSVMYLDTPPSQVETNDTVKKLDALED